jgi:tetratricopeptide (TPR) repeat protein
VEPESAAGDHEEPLRPGVLPRLVRSLYTKRRTGTLRFAREGEQCSVRFLKGHIVFGSATAPKLHMGEVLVTQGLLSDESLARATHLMLSQRIRLGEALQSLGIVDLELLEEFLSFHVLAILVHVLSWRDGTCSFREQDPALAEDADFPLKMTTGELTLEACRRLTDRDSIQFALGDLDRVLLASTDPLVRFQRVTLNPTDAFVLSRVDGTLTAREIVSITPLAPEAVEQSLVALLLTGILEFAPPKEAKELPGSPQFLRQEILEVSKSLPTLNHFQVLGLGESATDAEVKAAYFRLAKRYHPDVHHHISLADLRDPIEKVFLRLGEAYEALETEERRAAYKRRIAPPAAPTPAAPDPPAPAALGAVQVEEMFGRAKERFGDGKYWEAIALLGEVIPLSTGRVKLQARVLMAKAYLKYPEKAREAERELLEVVQVQPDNVEATYLLGTFYLHRGLGARAEALFKRVLELKPNHREAIAQLESAKPKEEGLLKKFFRRT